MKPSCIGRLGAAFLTLFLAASAVPVRAQQPAALLVQFRGEVKVLRGEGDTQLAPHVGLKLREGDRVRVPRGGRAVLLLRSGRLLTASTPVQVTAEGVADASKLFGETVGALDRASGAEPPPEKGGGRRPAPGVVAPRVPAGGVTILEGRPEFVWTSAEGAEGYTVQIRPVDGGEVLRFRTGSDTTWTLPADGLPLEPGAEYAWTVVAGRQGRTTAEERFRVVDAGELQDVADFFGRLEAQGVDPRDEGLFLAAVFFNDRNLAYEALRALKALEGSGVPLGPEVRMLEAEAYLKVGDREAARRAWERATGSPESPGRR